MDRLLALLLLGLPLAGCQPSLVTDFNLSDIVSVGETETAVVVLARLTIPFPDAEACEGGLTTLLQAAEGLLPVRGEPRCVSDSDREAQAEIATLTTLIPSQGERPIDGGFVIEVDASHEGGGTAYELTFVPVHFREQVGLLIPAADTGAAPIIEFDVTNDTATAFAVQSDIAGSSEVLDLAPGGKAHIRLIEAVANSVAEGNSHMFMTAYPVR